MKLPGRGRAMVSERKITGRHKAVWLMAFGFTRTRWIDLAEALRLHEGSLVTPDRRNPIARSVWFIEDGTDRPRFVTLYPVRRGEP